MDERGRAVVALLQLRHEWVFDHEKAPRSCLEGVFELGEKATEWFECPRCSGRKTVGQGKASRPCDRCGGEGRVLGDSRTFGARKSPQALAYERATGVAEDEKLAQRRRSGELRRLKREELHREGKIAADEREPWEAAKAELYRDFSLSELDRALDLLEQQSAYDRSAVEIVYGYDAPLRTVGAALQARADRAVGMLARLMPDNIRTPDRAGDLAGKGRWANGEQQRQRDREVWRLHLQEGLNREQIARRVGLDRSTVSRILSKQAA